MNAFAPLLQSTALQNVDYLDFLRAKIAAAPSFGADVAAWGDYRINPILKPHQAAIVRWAIEGGRRAIFARFGLGKSVMQLEICRILRTWTGDRALIVCPLGVRQEFARDAAMLGIATRFARSSAAILDHERALSAEAGCEGARFDGIWLTNYESVRDGKIDVAGLFSIATLDEASCLRGFGGTKTFREFMRLFDGVPYKFVATATPSPNEYIELLAYAAFLEVMDVGQAKTRFFKRNSEKADQLTIHPHKEAEFWHWVNSWAAFVQKPSDLGFSDEGYDLPPIEVRWHEVATDHAQAGFEKSGQGRLLKADAIGVVDASREKRDSLSARVAKMMELRAEDPDAHRLLWHDLEAERAAIEAAIPNVVSVYGTQDLDARERAIIAFSDGEVRELAAKPVLAGSGCNFQRHCHWAIFLGIGFKFNDFVQAIHRIQRFLQPHPVRIDLIYSEAERAVRARLEEKWRRHDETAERMSEIIRTYGLGLIGAGDVLARTISAGEDPLVEQGTPLPGSAVPAWRVANRDTVIETRSMASDSVGLIVTSIPFSTQYEYTPSYNDFGHTDDNAHFFAQMDYLTPELLRVLQPGRVAAIHVKDRIRPGGMDGLGFQTVDPFHSQCIDHYRAHGFAYLGMITVVTDVVRENNQTYRLGWSEKAKDGTRMGVGMPEYVLLFRKAQTDRSRGYADDPVTKTKPLCLAPDGEAVPWDEAMAAEKDGGPDLWPIPGSGFSRAKWQIDASGYWRSSGDRLLTIDDFAGLPHDAIYRLFRGHSFATVYDYDAHVLISEQMEAKAALPTDFALLPAQSWHPQVWTDVARMRTLNGEQSAKGREMHLCPLQFDIVDRLIEDRSMPGELVYDPFGGLMTVPLRAVKLGRRGAAAELNPGYFADGVRILREADAGRATGSLFDLLAVEDAA
ncbi:DNA methylase [Sphingomonas sp. YR710]|uniref:DNA methyltransferase n=1 Tax=Sphingomonas sp. YR710 TaxID=1882773 RepID=UPI0008848672|nr:DNA methyltransferase [Sphingomonas sp. YR710]SDC30398.1 DNA methylase [Sphingomonas sp. YR710]